MKDSISLQFLGAAQTVTGSKHLLRTPSLNILIDCGLFQGLKTLRLKNWEPLEVDVSEINILILTHAHLDHCGYIPLLIRQGFKGRILMSPPTRDLTEIILRDSARIQEEDAERANKNGNSKHNPALPLYTEKDVNKSLQYFETHEDNTCIDLSNDIKIRFQKNGHILGSVFIEMDCYGKRIVFSGDIGRASSELLTPPTLISEADFLIMESTYGNRLHKQTSAKDNLSEVISDALDYNGNILIPSFAVGRAQELMLMISELKASDKIPDVPVILDSPMGAEATRILFKYPDWHRLTEKQCNKIINSIQIVSDYKETLKILKDKSSKIVIAASGMLTGGRVLEYIKKYSKSRKNTVLLAGYQAEGTRGRALKEGSHEIKIHGRYYKLHCNIVDITSLSAHADQFEMLSWIKQFSRLPQNIYLVHGEPIALDAFRVKLKDTLNVNVIVPAQNEIHTLFELKNEV